MFFSLNRPFDSHLHLLGLGQRQFIHQLEGKSVQQLLNLDKIKHREDFTMGFGWKLSDSEIKEVLEKIDGYFNDSPIFLSRWDGHASLINSAAAQYLGLLPQAQLLTEAKHFEALQKLPQFSPSQLQHILKISLNFLNSQGFTHFRDMTSSEPEFKAWLQIFQQQRPTGFIQFYFQVSDLSQLQKRLIQLNDLKTQQTKYLRVQGVKVFIDGTLGSGTADTKCLCHHQGSPWTDAHLDELFLQTWQSGFEIACHCIGENAVDKVVETARRTLAKGVTGHLHIEHAELISKSTLQKLKSIHCTVHIQPSHAIDDLKLFKDELKDTLIFPLESLLQLKVPVFLGSDAPIVESSFQKTAEGLKLILNRKNQDQLSEFLKRHQHPSSGSPFSEVYLNSELKPIKLFFEDQVLFDHTTK